MILEELLRPLRTTSELTPEQKQIQIQHVEMDSRNVTSGSLFICIKGYTVDGHDFADKAIEQGAAAIIAERSLDVSVPLILVDDAKRAMARIASHFYDEPTKKLQLIGVTGTNGKTSTTHILDQILRDADQKTGLIGTMYTKIDDQFFDTANTTPESLVLQQTFNNMNQAGVDTAVMEVSSHALHHGRVRGCDFDIAVFTNLTPDHLDYHETMEKYLFAKSLLFSQLGNTYEGKKAVINIDDLSGPRLAQLTTAEIVTYGIRKSADVRAKDIKSTPEGTTFVLEAFGEETTVSFKLVGLFSVYNALAAVAAAIASGLELEQVKESIERVQGIAGRFEPVQCGQPFSVIVDYAHTADSLKNVLDTVSELTNGQVTVVVGCGGDRDASKRPVMAEIAVKQADRAIFTSDNPRSEDPELILKDMTSGLLADNYETILDRKQAIYRAIEEAEEGDVVLIAGKGHETYQDIAGVKHHFDDKEVAEEAIRGRLT
ncbi:UDP-N-acetylmuramoyl-L-alanyl-D-glutamate--2,6-diaminopimelate ligase [Alkalicoccobacillus plakortidis]|uniref:UDP-N-acetylmuramoyl-L-alanyl-D-glutamate--2,6-diaminopimelate ligase n=1 Tax=Alkalicoccobacillus plakortidis TaxID=444060 RepID=A0ABT0XFZ4_9BACI|nr:UDP-N-acetylmuramoyl-L-alanyl-D-glutamate--2,6-diaminopimelate ligase [Alkalicoccobacillus plakortidis]MCM2674825.1 UDP-N-acetylmuramoyl-L-alanyl-D-glutamate--2,6-diaminopimelate ligase [Alkalicoccobacillus plakortidis]